MRLKLVISALLFMFRIFKILWAANQKTIEKGDHRMKFFSTIAFAIVLAFPSFAQLSPENREELFARIEYMCSDADADVTRFIKFQGEGTARGILKLVGTDISGSITVEQYENLEQMLQDFRTNPTICKFEAINVLLPVFQGQKNELKVQLPKFNEKCTQYACYAFKGCIRENLIYTCRHDVRLVNKGKALVPRNDYTSVYTSAGNIYSQSYLKIANLFERSYSGPHDKHQQRLSVPKGRSFPVTSQFSAVQPSEKIEFFYIAEIEFIVE